MSEGTSVRDAMARDVKRAVFLICFPMVNELLKLSGRSALETTHVNWSNTADVDESSKFGL